MKAPARPAATDRRTMLRGTALAMGGMAIPMLPEPALANEDAARQDRVSAGAGKAEAATRFGKVAGYRRDGIFAFKGIPYGDDTAGHLVAALPHARAVRFENSGHAPHLEEPDLFNTTLKDFADTLVRTNRSTQS